MHRVEGMPPSDAELWERLDSIGEELAGGCLEEEEVSFLLQRASYLMGELHHLYRG